MSEQRPPRKRRNRSLERRTEPGHPHKHPDARVTQGRGPREEPGSHDAEDRYELTVDFRLTSLGIPRDLTPVRSGLSLRYARLAVVALLCAAALVMIARVNIRDANFWYDEAGQFWMAKGLSHFSQPNAPEGGLGAVLAENSRHNLDPGGFTLLLHFWAKIGTSPEWLRCLPYSFFVLGVVSLALIGWKSSHSAIIAGGAALLICFEDQLLHYAFELRAYSMESSGVLIVSLALLCAVRDDRPRSYLVLGLAMSVFLSARYSFAIYCFAGCTLCLVRLLRARRLDSLKASCLLGPPALSGILIYLLMLSKQNRGAAPPPYVWELMLSGKTVREALRIVEDNLETPQLIRIAVLIAVYGTVRIAERMSRVTHMPPALGVFAPFAGLVLIASVLLSVIGKYPFAISSRWGLHLHALSLVALVAMASALKEWAGVWLSSQSRITRRGVVAALCCCSVAYCSLALQRGNGFKRLPGESLFSNLARMESSRIERSRFFVGRNASPLVRYLFEYGPLRQVCDYPSGFTFETTEEYRRQNRLPIDANGIDLVLLSHYGWPNSLEQERDIYMTRSDAPLAIVSTIPPSFVLERVRPGVLKNGVRS